MTTYTMDECKALRDDVIVLRDEALKQNDFEWSVKLSHVVAAMAQLIVACEPCRDNPDADPMRYRP